MEEKKIGGGRGRARKGKREEKKKKKKKSGRPFSFLFSPPNSRRRCRLFFSRAKTAPATLSVALLDTGDSARSHSPLRHVPRAPRRTFLPELAKKRTASSSLSPLFPFLLSRPQSSLRPQTKHQTGKEAAPGGGQAAGRGVEREREKGISVVNKRRES